MVFGGITWFLGGSHGFLGDHMVLGGVTWFFGGITWFFGGSHGFWGDHMVFGGDHMVFLGNGRRISHRQIYYINKMITKIDWIIVILQSHTGGSRNTTRLLQPPTPTPSPTIGKLMTSPSWSDLGLNENYSVCNHDVGTSLHMEP